MEHGDPADSRQRATSSAGADAQLAAALVAEACRRSSMLWLRPHGSRRAHAAWHVWHTGAAYVVHGGSEQRLPELLGVDPVEVTVRSKDDGGRLVTWHAAATAVEPTDGEWEAVVAALHAARLNAPDGEEQPARWARESHVVRLGPRGPLAEQPGAMPTSSHAAPPPPSPATTRGRLPFVLGRRRPRR